MPKDINEELYEALMNKQFHRTKRLLQKCNIHDKTSLYNIPFLVQYNKLYTYGISAVDKENVQLYEAVLEDDIELTEKLLRYCNPKTTFMHNFCLLTFCSSMTMCRLLLENGFHFFAHSSTQAYHSVEYLLAYPVVFHHLCLQNELQTHHHPRVKDFWMNKINTVGKFIPSDLTYIMKDIVGI